MTTQLMSLPEFQVLTFDIATNGGWYDVIPFTHADGTAIDLTGLTFEADLKKSSGDAGHILNISTADGTLTNGTTTGKLTFNVPAASLAALTPGIYLMDLLATETSSGKIRNLCEIGPAQVTIIEGITR